MKYPNLSALVPEGEHFDESAIVNEGGWISSAHLDNIEAAFANHAQAVVNHEQAINTLNEQLTTANDARTAAENSLTEANSTISERNTRIQELETQIAKLENKPAGNMQHAAPEGDQAPVDPTKNERNKYHTSFDDHAEAYL